MDGSAKTTPWPWRLLSEEDGPSATEYAILLGLIVLVAAASIRAVGEKMFVLYEAINGTMPT